MIELLSQLEQVDSASPLARRLDGNISDGIALGSNTQIRSSNPAGDDTARLPGDRAYLSNGLATRFSVS